MNLKSIEINLLQRNEKQSPSTCTLPSRKQDVLSHISGLYRTCSLLVRLAVTAHLLFCIESFISFIFLLMSPDIPWPWLLLPSIPPFFLIFWPMLSGCGMPSSSS